MVKIDKIDFGEIIIDGRSFYSDVSISAGGDVEHLPKSHSIGAGDIAPLLKGKPDCFVIGTGMEGSVGIAEEVGEILENKGIKFFIDKTPNAADIFNGLVASGKKAAGIFLMTA